MKESIGAELESFFPRLVSEGYRRTSSKSKVYNCVAWAMGDTSNWWQPSRGPGIFWPAEVPVFDHFENYLKVFESAGYASCADDCHEPGFEKVALYQCRDGSFGHAARQVAFEDGRFSWSSKLGKEEDISHHSLEALESDDYGRVAAILRRPLQETA